jgi:hypothetical protein
MTAIATQMLDVPPLPCVVDAGHGDTAPKVFDAWSWCVSDVLEWRRPTGPSATFDLARPIEGDNPPGLVFVIHNHRPRAHEAGGGEREREGSTAASDFLPSELARLHAFGYGLDQERALAPWAIDDATDLLYAHRVRPRDILWLAADSLAALVWGLHDWAHFHNHGPFDQPAMTELQCDLVALAWLRENAPRIGLDAAHVERVARSLATLSRRRFNEEGIAPPTADLEPLFLGPYPRSLR